jgi:hypothetical protein
MEQENNNQPKYYATHHACQRAKERLNWTPKTLNRMLPRIFTQGLCIENTKGTLRRYLSNRLKDAPEGTKLRVYGEYLYIFREHGLITLFPLHSDLKNYIQKNKQ